MAANHRSLPSPAGSHGLVKPATTTTQVFKVSKYAKAAAGMPTGKSLKSKTFRFDGRQWRIKVYPRGKSFAYGAPGFAHDAPDFVAVFVKCYGEAFRRSRPDVEVTIEILDGAGEHTFFDNHTAESNMVTNGDGSAFSKGYVRFARRRELEASSCVRDDSFKVRCTLLAGAKAAKPSSSSSLVPWRNTSKIADKAKQVVPKPSPAGTLAPPSSETDAVSDRLPEVVAGSHTLAISGFSEKKTSLRAGECVRSHQFNVGGSNWCIKVYPNGHDEQDRDSVSIFLARGKSDEPATAAEFSFELVSVLDVGNHKSAKMTRTFDVANPQHLGLQRPASELHRQMRSDLLVVRCRLGVIKGKMPDPHLAAPPAVAVPRYDRSSGFLWLLKSEEGSDVTFGVRGTTFRAHTCILAAQSPVLRSEMRALREDPECAWRYVAVDEEISAEAFEALLHVAYTDHLPDMGPLRPTEEAVESMLFAAERYDMERLKLRCEEWVATHVSVRTVAGYLSLAERTGCELLKAACIEFATPDHIWDAVKEGDGFNRLRATCPQIVRGIESKQRQY
ncbi:hypothetical protein ACP70R_010810 [Stipagrostis hirtigluma subsp. patula]